MTPGSKSKVKSSAQRGIRAKVLESYPLLEPYIEEILPKKEQLDLVKLYVLPQHSPSYPTLPYPTLPLTIPPQRVTKTNPCMD